MKATDQYHVGIIVDDFDAALAWFAAVGGYRWCPDVTADVPVILPSGETTLSMRISYSIDEPRLELVQSIPGTIWQPADSGLHHLGYWSDDVDADVAHLLAQGMELEASAPFPEGGLLWAYCKAPGGTRIELVNRAIEPMIRTWIEMPPTG